MIPERKAGPQGWRPCANCGAVASIPPSGTTCVLCHFPEGKDDGPDPAILAEMADRLRLAPLLDQEALAIVNEDDLARIQGRGGGRGTGR